VLDGQSKNMTLTSWQGWQGQAYLVGQQMVTWLS